MEIKVSPAGSREQGASTINSNKPQPHTQPHCVVQCTFVYVIIIMIVIVIIIVIIRGMWMLDVVAWSLGRLVRLLGIIIHYW